MSETITNNTEQQPTTQTPEVSGDQGGGRMFSQEEVNRIISDRLSREREKLQSVGEDNARQQALKAREARLDCREYLDTQGFPADLLELLDCSDAETFKAKVEQLDKLVQLPSRNRKPAPHFGRPTGGITSSSGATEAAIAEAFKPKI